MTQRLVLTEIYKENILAWVVKNYLNDMWAQLKGCGYSEYIVEPWDENR
jgi:hypothetical protein